MSDDIVPPHSLEAERAVLGAALVEMRAADYAANRLPARAFYRRAHARLFEAIRALRDADKGVDLVTLLAELGADLGDVGGPAYIAGLMDGVPRGSHVAHYADILEDLLGRREVMTYARDLLSAVVAGRSSAELLAEADRGLVDLHDGRHGSGLRDLAATTADVFRDVQYRAEHRGELTGWDTGFQTLNELTFGWQRGDLIVVAARPSIGKTIFALNTATAVARAGGRVAIFSLEMKRRQLEYRMLSALSGVPYTRIQSGYYGSDEIGTVSAALDVMHELPIWIDDASGQTAQDVRRGCRQLVADAGVDLVVIDYVQLMPGTLARRNATRTEEVTDISRRLKVLAGDLNVPIVLLSQLSRASEGRADPRPKLTDLRESGSLEQDADVVILLHRKHHREDGITEAIVEKHRNGPTGSVNLSIERAVQRFTDAGETPAPVEEPKPPRPQGLFRGRRRA